MKEITCQKCGYKWTPKITAPKCCPSCKSYTYNKPLIKR